MTCSSIRIPLDANHEQEANFWRYAGASRWAYNFALNASIEEYKLLGKMPTAYDLIKRLTTMKRTEEFAWLKEISKQVPQYAVHNLDKAFKAFFTGRKSGRKVGYPKFKKHGKSKPSFTFGDTAGLGNCIRGNKIMLPCIGEVRFAERHPSFPTEGRPLSITVSYHGERWWAAITYEVPEVKTPANGLPSVGVDLGLAAFATLSTGEKIGSPKPLRKALKRVKRLQRRVSRSQKGSHRREQKRRVLARAHARCRNIRSNFIHQLTARLAKNHGQVVIEDLNVRGMMSNRHLAFAIGDMGWGEFRRQLGYKCPRHGSSLVVADRFYPSSKCCSACGFVVDKLPLNVREWTCEACGTHHDRDENAAINLNQLGQNMPEVTRVEIGGSGGEQSPSVPVKETRSTRKAFALIGE